MFVVMPIEERVPAYASLFDMELNQDDCFFDNRDDVFSCKAPNTTPCSEAPPSYTSMQSAFAFTDLDASRSGDHAHRSCNDADGCGDLCTSHLVADAYQSSTQLDRLQAMEDIVIKEVLKDVDEACRQLSIPKDPTLWTVDQVCRWVSSTLIRYNLPTAVTECFLLNGVSLCMLREEDFIARAPVCGSTLYAQLEVWRNATSLSPVTKEFTSSTCPLWLDNLSSTYCTPLYNQALPSENMPTDQKRSPGVSGFSSCMFPSGAISPSHAPAALRPPSSPTPSESSMDSSLSTESELVTEVSSSDGGKSPRSKNTIHLWQFLRELLDTPGTEPYIKWLNQSTGVFKIQDSTKVAQLWGKRKNRPAMNYDKLSRSVRQYYKKGIIKKTDQSKRLVYQFCEPYLHLRNPGLRRSCSE